MSASELHAVIWIERDLARDAPHLLTHKPGLADRIPVVVKNDGKFFCRRRLGRLLDDRNMIGKFGLATKAAVGRVSPPADLGLRLDRAAASAFRALTIRPFAMSGRTVAGSGGGKHSLGKLRILVVAHLLRPDRRRARDHDDLIAWAEAASLHRG